VFDRKTLLYVVEDQSIALRKSFSLSGVKTPTTVPIPYSHSVSNLHCRSSKELFGSGILRRTGKLRRDEMKDEEPENAGKCAKNTFWIPVLNSSCVFVTI